MVASGQAQRLEQLAQPRTARYRLYAQRKEQLELEQLLSQCTFRPKVNSADRPSAPVVDRLYSTGDANAALREQQRLRQRAAETDGCTFAPHLVSTSRAPRNRVPLQERAAQERAARAAKLAKLQVCCSLQTGKHANPYVWPQRCVKHSTLRSSTATGRRSVPRRWQALCNVECHSV